MICCAVEDSTRFIGISNKAACFYSFQDYETTLALDEHLIEVEKNMPEARRKKIETRKEECQKGKAQGAFQGAIALKDLEDEPEYPMGAISSDSVNNRGIVAKYSIDLSKSVFGDPVTPYASCLDISNESIRCHTCFDILDSYPIVPCKGCTVGFCSERCAKLSSHHSLLCQHEWTTIMPDMTRIGLSLHLRSLNSGETDKGDEKKQTEKNDQNQGAPVSPCDPRSHSEIYGDDLSLIRSLQTHESLLAFNTVLLPTILDAVLIAKLLPDLNINARRLMLDILICNVNAFEIVQTVTVDPHDSTATGAVWCGSCGFAIYGAPSYLNHSCAPNTVNSYDRESNRMLIRATERIESGQEIFHCYGPAAFEVDYKERQRRLKKRFYFTCECNACVKDTTESPKSVYFENEEDIDRRLEAFTKVAENKTNHAELVSEIEKTRKDFAKTLRDIDRAEAVGETAKYIELKKQVMAIGLKKYELLFKVTNGEGFDPKITKLSDIPALPSNPTIQREFASQYDEISHHYAQTDAMDLAAENCRYSLAILERHYPEFCLDIGYEYSKLASIYLRLLLDGKNPARLGEVLRIFQREYDCWRVCLGPKHESTERAKRQLDMIKGVLQLRKAAQKGQKDANTNAEGSPNEEEEKKEVKE